MAAEHSAYEVFRPRRARAVAWSFVVVVLVVLVGLALLMAVQSRVDWGLQDTVLLIVLSIGIAYSISRFATIRAQPSPTGMTVRNILVTTHISWTDVTRVRFSPNDPWAYLVLARGDDLPVMAIQRSDGPYARQQAGRLAALVQAHGTDPQTRP